MSRLTRTRARTTVDPIAPPPSAPRLRLQVLRDNLLPTVELLSQRRADQIGDGFVADYLALDWLEWNGGLLRLTVTGENVCSQPRAAWSE